MTRTSVGWSVRCVIVEETDRNFFQKYESVSIVDSGRLAPKTALRQKVSGGRYVSGQRLFEIHDGVSFDGKFASL